MKVLSYGVLLYVFWFLLSGHFEYLLLGLGVASIVMTIFLAKRMNIIDHESYPLHLASKYPAFLFYVFREIVYANIDVVKRIMKPGKKSIAPQLVEISVPQKTDLGRVSYANAITLSPGTLSVVLKKEKLIAHTLTREAADYLSSGRLAKFIPDQVVD